MARRKKIIVPLADRPFCVGNAELAGYLVVDEETLKENYLRKGLKPVMRERKLYYFKTDIEKFLRKNDMYQEVRAM